MPGVDVEEKTVILSLEQWISRTQGSGEGGLVQFNIGQGPISLPSALLLREGPVYIPQPQEPVCKPHQNVGLSLGANLDFLAFQTYS